MNTAEKRATAALWSVRGVGAVTLDTTRKLFGSLGELLERPVASWAPLVPWRDPIVAERMLAIETLASRADWLEARCRRDGVRMLFPGDRAFPEKLVGIDKAPGVLFARGPVCDAPPRRRLAIVGTRTLPPDLCDRVIEIAAEAASVGLCIVSGAADGTDRAAHAGAVRVGGETWAFMGGALDQLDLAQRELAPRLLAAGGSVLSDYPPGFRPNRSSFTLRNRLISGASDAVLIVRAGVKSGALHTATAALAQKRPLLCTAGAPWDERCRGTNQLLQEGKARLHLHLGDLLAAVGLDGELLEAPHTPMDLTGLTPESTAVLDELGKGSGDFEALLERLPAYSSGQLSAALNELELFGAVVHKGGRRYEKR